MLFLKRRDCSYLNTSHLHLSFSTHSTMSSIEKVYTCLIKFSLQVGNVQYDIIGHENEGSFTHCASFAFVLHTLMSLDIDSWNTIV